MTKCGVNGFSGEIIKLILPQGVITQGSAIPVSLKFTNDGSAMDVTGCQLIVSVDTVLSTGATDMPILSRSIPTSTTPIDGSFFGYVTDDDTKLLTTGNNYISIKYIDSDSNALTWRKYKLN